MTRAGNVFAYTTDAPACSPGSWPRFHHDNANSGDYRRDAVSPGKPTNAAISGANVNFTAPGDDLLCGTADHYEIVQSNTRSPAPTSRPASPSRGAPAPAAAGTTQSFAMPANPKRFVAIRAVDEQGNVGRIAQVETSVGLRSAQAATPVNLPLVPAFEPCTSPNAIARSRRSPCLPATRPAQSSALPDGGHARRERKVAPGVLRQHAAEDDRREPDQPEQRRPGRHRDHDELHRRAQAVGSIRLHRRASRRCSPFG